MSDPAGIIRFVSKTFDNVVGEILALREEVADMRLRYGAGIDGLRLDYGTLGADVTGLRTEFHAFRGETQTRLRSVSGELAALRAQCTVLEEGVADLRANQLSGAELKSELGEIRKEQGQMMALLVRTLGH